MEISENFSYVGPKQNFDRDNYTTLAEMKAVSDKNMPSIFLATCEETGKLYIYKKTNTADSVSGKWRDATIDESAPKLTAEQISHLLYQFADLPTASTAGFPIENGTRLYNSTDKKIYVASVAQDGSITWKAETSVDSSSGSGSGSGGSGGSSSNPGGSGGSGDSGGSGSGSAPGGSGSDPVTVASPVISITDGNVTITCATIGATIYYTTNGTTPTINSTAYAEPFTVENGITVQAIAAKDGVLSSVASKTYTASSGGTDPSPSEPDDPVVEKDYAYYGFLSGTLETTEKITDEGIDVSEASVKTLTKEEATSKARTCTYVATQAEEDAAGQSFLIYAYPAKFGELTQYNFGLGPNPISPNFTKFEFTIDGINYYIYAQTRGSAPGVGDTVHYTFE